ncbi:unnamed protein product [Clonostachys rosea]|uniref:Uncharacterized protein n=1 Tax=Bionectria ochroleuca TaxID=29856 RepID=A0ABY6UI99_BIOOC|nr:unnamed protein product [Clonostachys rosea]
MLSSTIFLLSMAGLLPSTHAMAIPLPFTITTRDSEDDHRGFPKGAIIGIVVSVVAIGIILTVFRFGAIMSMRRKQDLKYVQQVRSTNGSPNFDYDRNKYSSSPAVPLLASTQLPAASSMPAAPSWTGPQEPPPAYTPMINNNSSASANPVP